MIEGSDGWAITGIMASLTLSVSNSIVKLIFTLIMKAKSSYHPISQLSSNF